MTREYEHDELIGQAYETASDIQDSSTEWMVKNGIARIAHMDRAAKNMEDHEYEEIEQKLFDGTEGLAKIFDYQNEDGRISSDTVEEGDMGRIEEVLQSAARKYAVGWEAMTNKHDSLAAEYGDKLFKNDRATNDAKNAVKEFTELF